MATRKLTTPANPVQRAFGYARVSTDMPADSGISLDEQRIQDAKRNLRRGNRHQGGSRPFGYRFGRANGHGKARELIPDPSEQAAIADVLALRGEGKSLMAIRTRCAAAVSGSATSWWRTHCSGTRRLGSAGRERGRERTAGHHLRPSNASRRRWRPRPISKP